MKYIEKNISKIILIFLIMQPIIDVLTAISIHYLNMDFTFGMIIRFLFLMFCCFYIIFINKDKQKKYIFLYFILLLVYSILYLLNSYVNEKTSLFLNITNLLKIIYIPILTIFFYLVYKDKKVNIDKSWLGKIYIIYLLFIFIPNILGIGLKTYEITKEGSIGLFYTANEVGAVISILMPFFLIYIFSLKNNTLKLFIILIFLYTLLSIGTKGPVICFGLIYLYYFIKSFIKYIKNKKYKRLCFIISLFLISITSVILIFPTTNFYKNIKTHLDFLKVDSINDLIDYRKIDQLIFSERISFLEKTNKLYKTKNAATQLLGLGYTKNNVEMKTIEMDYIDIFYHQGILGFVIILLPYIIIIIKIIKKYFKYREKEKIEIFMLSFILSILLALLTGHVLLSPNVFIFVAIIMNMFYNELRAVSL